MKFVIKYLPILFCTLFIFTACNKEATQPDNNDLPQTKSKQTLDCNITYLTSTFKEMTVGNTVTASIRGGRVDTKVKTFSYNISNATNANRTYLKISGFDDGCSCYSPSDDANGCKRLVIKDKYGNVVLNTLCQPVDKFVKISGTQFSVILNVPCWIGGSSEVNIEAMDW
ncbi:hypothetical protein [Microscilla marina]|uniref:Lipoprotein, putative n=1 Tax=Microscilla marina ATCC 23134 TaxID=313606 RepID=A1ZGA5_MICM2|nr:hypothetical protein [Microscilla marina]EAY30522.1 lipoprotein, putative [Microscilla marina ATCC 23134]